MVAKGAACDGLDDMPGSSVVFWRRFSAPPVVKIREKGRFEADYQPKRVEARPDVGAAPEGERSSPGEMICSDEFEGYTMVDVYCAQI